MAANTSAATQQSFMLPLSFEHESNPLFSVTDAQSINRVILAPNYSLTVNQGSEEWRAIAGLRLERSSDITISSDRNDPSLELGWRHSYETGQFDLMANMDEQSTRISDFSGSELIGDNTRKNRSVSINWLNSLSDRTALTLAGVATKVVFEGQVTTGLVNYNHELVNARLNHILSEKMEIFTQLSFSRYKPEEGTNSLNSETKGFNFGFIWNVNEKLDVTASAGTNETQSISNNKTWQAMLNVQYTTAHTNSHIGISRGLSPGSTGSINETNQLEAGWIYNLSERDIFELNINWGENLTLNRTETKSLSVNYTRHISLSWDFRLSAAHRNRNDILGSASSNSVMASIIYNLPNF